MTDVGGRTTKHTYVTKYTTDVDPRTLPDFASRGVVTDDDYRDSGNGHRHPRRAAPPPPAPAPAPAARAGGAVARRQPHSPSYSASPDSSVADSADTVDGHRLRKKYTTTTVTTITTTTILLPKTQEAYVFPSTTTHQMEQQDHARPALTNGQSYEEAPPQLSRQADRVYQIESGHTSASASPDRHRQLQTSSPHGNRLVPAQAQYGPDGRGTQSWTFNQQTQNNVTTEEHRGRLPTLQELGITSYFGKDGQNGVAQQRPSPYVPAPRNGGGAHQPWVTSETRHEVEGGKRYY